MKKILIALLILASTAGFSLAREDGVNIYDTPREPPSRPIYTETGRKVNLADFKGDLSATTVSGLFSFRRIRSGIRLTK